MRTHLRMFNGGRYCVFPETLPETFLELNITKGKKPIEIIKSSDIRNGEEHTGNSFLFYNR